MAASLSPERSFAEATAIKQLSSHTYEAYFPDDWCIGSVPHGGFVTSCFLQVAATHFGTTLSAQKQPHTITLHLDFLRRTGVGPATFTVTDVKLGRQTSVIHVALAQAQGHDPAAHARQEVVGYLTNSNVTTESGLTLDTTYRLEPPPPPVDLHALRRGDDAHWAWRERMPFSGFRRASEKVRFHFPRAGQPQGIGDEWLCFANGERFTDATLGYLVDIFPMPAESLMDSRNPYEPSERGDGEEAGETRAERWYPTLVLNLDIKKSLPDEGVEWLFARVLAKRIQNGRMDLEVVILDEAGDIVALSHHVTLALGAERNLAKRRHIGSSNL
ncbi:MAG: hypothetical protein M1818_001011 [Claussenomyces sp. TS43310]|nr:MAG: hypothetical protein M1818_001011 [Claussenomyces sp. TS43310]